MTFNIIALIVIAILLVLDYAMLRAEQTREPRGCIGSGGRNTMSDDLIKRSDAIKAVSKVDDYGDGIGFEVRSHCLVELELVPSADRPQGEWIYTDDPLRLDDEWACSRCGNISFVKTNYCDRCGCRMRKENE